MLNGYQFDAALNLDKVFKCTPPPKINFSILPKLAKDWRAELEVILYQSESCLEKKSLEKHLGADSSYQSKKILAEQLQLIYYRLQGDLDTELGQLSDDARKALLSKLTEEITQCTAGFHNRVNAIVASFQRPRNLEQLLYLVRTTIVEEVAFSLTNEVHAWNQVSVIAATEGLGIKPIFSGDPHSGNLIDDSIGKALREKFQKKFTPFNLPNLLVHALMGLLPELEVEKSEIETGEKEGLCSETVEKIIKLIKCYVPNSITSDPLDWQKYFNIYEDCIFNVNWNAVYRYFYQELSKENYFKQAPEIHHLVDRAYYHLTLTEPDPTDHESSYINQLFDNQLFDEKDYSNFDSSLLYQLEKLEINFPDYYRHVTGNPSLIKRSVELIPYLQKKFPDSENYRSGIMQGFHLLTTLNLEVDEYVILRIAYTLLLKNQINYTPLMLAALNDPNIVEGILKFLIQHQTIIDIDICRQLFLAKDKYDRNALMLAVAYQPIAATLMLSFFDTYLLSSPDKTIKKSAVDLIQEIFLEKQGNNYNVLMLAASKRAQIALNILGFLTKHISSFAQNTLQTLFTAKQGNSYTAFTSTASNHPEYVKNILSFIEKHIKKFDPEALRELFFSGQQGTACTALMLAADNQAEATQAILDFITAYIEKFDPKLIRQMFLEKDGREDTALMSAAKAQTETVKIILSFIEQHRNIFFDEQLLIAEILLAKDEFGTTALMLAAENQPNAMILLLNFINKNIDILNIQVIRELLFKEIHDYEASMGVFLGGRFNTRKTLLMAAERKHPQVTEALLSFIDEHIERLMLEKRKHPQTASTLDEHAKRLEPDILTQLLLEKDGAGNNPFMRACTKHPRTMNGTLNFIANITEMESGAFNSVQTEIANFIFMQLARMSLEEPEEKTIVDKILLSSSPLLLTHFTKNYFAERPANLAYITNQLFECYLEELEDRTVRHISYTTPFSFFGWRYSTREKMDAAKKLKEIVQLDSFSLQQLNELDKKNRYHWPLTESRLGNLFAAYRSIADNAVDNRAETLHILDNNNTITPIEKPSTSATYLKQSVA